MLEALIEYQIASSLYKELLGAHGQLKAMLVRRPKDIDLMGQIMRVEKDIDALTMVIMNYRPLILHHFEQKHNFKWSWMNDVQGKKKAPDALGKMEVST